MREYKPKNGRSYWDVLHFSWTFPVFLPSSCLVNIILQALCQLTWLMALSAIGSSKVVSGKAVAEG